MRQAHDTVLGRLQKMLHAQNNDLTHQPLPQRWIDLIRHLNEKERKEPQPQSRNPQPAPYSTREGKKRGRTAANP